MYLEKLEVQGFKSFANKNVLKFPGMVDKTKRGITAVVGPNGSGKSNVADAVRWALGEQSMKTLRGKKSEDIIFSGSDKKGKLGMAEVSLYLNNEDKKAPLDYSQIVLTRRLYRNGDSEYIINGSRVRLSDLQMLLAKAKFGQKTYSVIGQGMVEGFLNTSLAERKEFFDEATGVKQFQIKRDDSLNKLKSSYENLGQAEMLLSEIEPRLKSLTRQVNKLKQRDEIEKELKDVQLDYYARIWHDIDKEFNQYNQKFLELEKIRITKDKKIESLNAELDSMKKENGGNKDYEKYQSELNILLSKKDDLNRKIARLDAQREIDLESKGQFDLSFLLSKKEANEKAVKQLVEEIEDLEKTLQAARSVDNDLALQKEKIDKEIAALNKKISAVSLDTQSEDSQRLNKKLARVLEKIKLLRKEDDIANLQQLIDDVAGDLKEILDNLEKDGSDKEKSRGEAWTEIQKQINVLIQAKEELVVKINENNLRVSARGERIKLLKEKMESISEELLEMETKIKQTSGDFNMASQEKEKAKLSRDLEEMEQAILDIKTKIGNINSEEEDKRNRLFSAQKDIQVLQNEINSLNLQLSDIKIHSTRYETRLEDLEIEIREEFGSLQAVKDAKENNEFDVELGREKIKQLKRQLEMIGGIDPEVEKEYIETKERFDFLNTQVEDFTKTVESLTKIIKELDQTIRENFDKEFKLIAVKFEEYFKILFNGGKAKIMKVMESSPEMEEEKADENGENKESKPALSGLDFNKIKFLQKHNATGLAGIEIQATPPGKKISSISMLSGGERALTAIALICAIISANPSPFVVLDEVDAALDEANSERLARILDELSHKTQFIAITHNRATMRRANVLYGVTMGDDGASKLLSVKLDQVKVE